MKFNDYVQIGKIDSSISNILLWSGGLDSTCYIIDLIEDKKIKKLTLLSIEDELLGKYKIVREKKARESILNILKEKYPKVNFNHITTKISRSGDFKTHVNELSQPIMWAITALMFEEIAYFHLGYVKGDCAIFKLDDIIKLIKTANDISGNYVEPKVNLIGYTKREILDRLLQFDFKYKTNLFNLITTCEKSSNEEQCYKCVTCNHFMEACVSLLSYISLSESDSDLHKYMYKKVSKFLKLNYQLKLNHPTLKSFKNNIESNLSLKVSNGESDYVKEEEEELDHEYVETKENTFEKDFNYTEFISSRLAWNRHVFNNSAINFENLHENMRPKDASIKYCNESDRVVLTLETKDNFTPIQLKELEDEITRAINYIKETFKITEDILIGVELIIFSSVDYSPNYKKHILFSV